MPDIKNILHICKFNKMLNFDLGLMCLFYVIIKVKITSYFKFYICLDSYTQSHFDSRKKRTKFFENCDLLLGSLWFSLLIFDWDSLYQFTYYMVELLCFNLLIIFLDFIYLFICYDTLSKWFDKADGFLYI